MRSDVEKEAGSITANIIVLIIALFIEGWGVMLMWGWFVAPTFGLPSLGLAQAIGIDLILSLITARISSEDVSIVRKVGYLIGIILMIVTAWIVHLFM